jgi:hypothetical protein
MNKKSFSNRFVKLANFALCAFVGFGLVGCLQSPLLNHADASSPSGSPGSVGSQGGNQHTQSDCDLAFSKAASHASLCAYVTWIKHPTADDEGEFVLRIWDPAHGTEAGPYVTPAEDVAVKLFMPEMGHGSSPTKVLATKDEHGVVVPGVFDVQNIFFVMNGKWQVFVQLKKGGQVIDQAEFDYNF